jgi:hypothetical protein
MTEQEQLLINLEAFWCQRMTELHEQGMVEDASALFSEFVLDNQDPFLDFDTKLQHWSFLQVI